MTFEKAFDFAYDKESERSAAKGEKFAVTPSTAKIAAFIWNMIAAADGEFDDFAYVVKDNSGIGHIVSVPKEEKAKKTKGAKTLKPSIEGDDGNENS